MGRLGVTTERVMREQAAIGFFDPRTIFDADGNLLPIVEWPDAAAAALLSLEIEETTEFRGKLHKVKFHPKPAALDAMMKYLGAYGENNRQLGAAAGNALGEQLTESLSAVTEKLRAHARPPDALPPGAG
jgi:phage terminase small subunit